MSGSISYLPGRRNRVLSGGTRNVIKLSRPWQAPLSSLINPDKCPFCTKPQEELPLPEGSPSGWKLLPNIYTPHANHSIVIPDHCWSAEELQRWGGPERIEEALRVAQVAVSTMNEEAVLLIHVGMQAGQNLGHPHMHVLQVSADKLISVHEFLHFADSVEDFVFKTKHFVVFAGGARAGECHILPKMNVGRFCDKSTSKSLAEVISDMIELGNEKFESVEGLAPPYGIAIRITKGGALRYAVYCPTLHNQGVLEYSIATLEGAPYVLPWPHEVTAAHLRNE